MKIEEEREIALSKQNLKGTMSRGLI